MCKYCDINSDECEIFIDCCSNDYYLVVPTSEWDYYNDDFKNASVYGIAFCPYCGRSLL